MSCIAASFPAIYPPHSLSNPVAQRTFLFSRIIAAFPAFLLCTSPTPICLSPGCLSNAINLHATNYSRDYAFLLRSQQSLLTNSANVLCNSDDAVPNKCDV